MNKIEHATKSVYVSTITVIHKIMTGEVKAHTMSIIEHKKSNNQNKICSQIN